MATSSTQEESMSIPSSPSTVSTVMPSKKRSCRSTRKLCTWIVEQVNSEKYPGVIWDDEAKTMFRIPWYPTHAGKQDFCSDEDAAFFKAWAEYKGNPKKRSVSDTAATWRTRMRCALNKSHEFSEVSDRSQLDIAEPYKVYRLVPLSEQGICSGSINVRLCNSPVTHSDYNMTSPQGARPKGHLSQDAPREIMTPNQCPSVATVCPMLSSPSQHFPEERMSCDTACNLSTTDYSGKVSLSSLYLQDEADLTTCFSACRMGESISLPRSHSLSSLSEIMCIENKASFRAKRSHSLNDVILLDKTQIITPDIIVVANGESYLFHCTQTGLFQCVVTGLVFKIKAEGDVTYRTVPWNQRLLAQLGKKPAGPLFDIKCPQGSVCQLHLPHCEICSTGGGKSLSVVHVMDEGIELIYPHVITETHVIINVTGFSGFGNVKDDDSLNPVRALVLLFYTPPLIIDDDPSSILKVLLLPGNVVLRQVLNERRSIHGDEIYIGNPPCELTPKQEYTLSISPQDDSIIIQPNKARFEVDESSYHNYIETFDVILEGRFRHVRLLLRNSNTSDCAWERCVQLSAPALRRQQVQHTLRLASEDRLFSVRSSFIDSVSLPVLNSVLDKLLEKRVLTDSEREMTGGMQANDKARFVIDTVRKKGPAARSSLILILCDTDPFLSKHLGLM